MEKKSVISPIRRRRSWSLFLLLILLPDVSSFSRHSLPYVTTNSRQGYGLAITSAPYQSFQVQSRPYARSPVPRSSSTTRRYSSSLISPHDAWGNWMVLWGNAALANYTSKHFTLGRLLGPPIAALALTFGMATCGILPVGGTVAAAQLQTLLLQLATPLVLLGADFRDAARRCGPLLISFGLAAVATMVASAVGWWAVGPWLSRCLGPADALKVCAGIMARNVGGGLNYMAVCASLQASPTALAAGLCADNILGLMYFPVVSYLAAGRIDPALEEAKQQSEDLKQTANGVADLETFEKSIVISVRPSTSSRLELQAQDNSTDVLVVSETSTSTRTSTENPQLRVSNTSLTSKKKDDAVTVERVTSVLFTSAALIWLGQRLGGARGALPMCTLLTVLLVNGVAPKKWVVSIQPTAQILGTVALYVFFSTLGSQGVMVAQSVRASMWPLGCFLGLLYGIHGLWMWTLHSLFRNRPSMAVPRLLVASSASIGGPATAVALSEANDWPSLKVPGLLAGNLGDSIGTFAGIAFFALFSGR